MHDSEHKQRTRSIPIFSYSRICTVDSSKNISEKISPILLLKILKIVLFAVGKENDKNLTKMPSGQKFLKKDSKYVRIYNINLYLQLKYCNDYLFYK